MGPPRVGDIRFDTDQVWDGCRWVPEGLLDSRSRELASYAQQAAYQQQAITAQLNALNQSYAKPALFIGVAPPEDDPTLLLLGD